MCRFMRRGAISFPQPASLVRKDVHNVEKWKQDTPSSQLWHHSSDALLYLLAPSTSRHLVPIPTEITGTSAASVSPVACPSVVSKDCLAHFQVIWIGWGGLPRSAAGSLFVCPFHLWNRYPSRKWKHETWVKKQPTTGHWPWLLEVKGERSGRQGHVLRVRGYR